MRPTTIAFVLAVVAAAGCGKKKEEPADPAPAPAAGDDAGMRPPRPPGTPKDMLDRAPFVIQLSFAEAERSKDSHTTVAHATLIGDKLFYKVTPEGARSDKRPAFELDNLTLTAAEVAALKQSIIDKNLLAATSIRAADAPRAPNTSVRADLKVRIDDRRNIVTVTGALHADGKPTALAATDAYRSLAALAAELRTLADGKRPPGK